MKNLDNSLILIARILMSILFIVAGYGKLGDAYAGTQAYMSSMGVPGFLLPLTILLELGAVSLYYWAFSPVQSLSLLPDLLY